MQFRGRRNRFSALIDSDATLPDLKKIELRPVADYTVSTIYIQKKQMEKDR
jgi:hypothetical protein